MREKASYSQYLDPEKLREKDQVFQAMKEKLTAQNAKATKEHMEVSEDLKSKSRDQDESLKQMAEKLEVRTTELKFESNQDNSRNNN